MGKNEGDRSSLMKAISASFRSKGLREAPGSNTRYPNRASGTEVYRPFWKKTPPGKKK